MGEHEIRKARTTPARSGRSRAKRPAVFLDRDGTIITQIDALTDPAQVELIPGAAEAIAELNRRGFLVIVLTNQPVIEKGLLTLDGLARIHEALRKKLAVAGAHLDAIYVCPHRYHAPGDPIPQCHCRKPDIGLIESAQADFPIDMERSWVIGDRLRDVATGQRAQLRTILVSTGGPDVDDNFFPDTKFDLTAIDLVAAVKLLP